ncbi:NirA family protein [Vineibacter terrae]|uniref:NirA family protein n=1 Tax=Vineibacter terrae TaxID=2586908 RepID=UPI002E315A76|nr:NirA family protein [Vineibacter terrae]HEX2890199.1 NirA family protein [Vineibacter terrae]
MSDESGFTPEQQQYLQGFFSGLAARGQSGGGQAAMREAPPSPHALHLDAQDHALAAGGKLVAEETAKRKKDPFQMWDEIQDNADAGRFPKGIDVFLTKFHGLFYVAPAQDSYMCRLRIPNGILNSFQMRGLADMADTLAGGYADVTTRANLQLREIGAAQAPAVLMGLADLGLTSRGSGADNIRNITGSPTAGIDRHELIDTRPLCRALHHTILNHRELYGLPRKFNVAFDGGGDIGVLEDTNDIGFVAVRVEAGHGVEPGVYFRCELGGITGHLDFARDTGLLLQPSDCVPVAVAMIRVFIKHGDRTDRRRARLKYLLDDWGFDRFIAESEAELGRALPRLPRAACVPRRAWSRQGHIGVHAQKQAGLNYIGIALPVGRMTSRQMRGLADLAQSLGSGTIRLTVWQNLLISDIPDDKIAAAKTTITALGLQWHASAIRAGLVACTGNTGCKFAASNTKGQAMVLADHLEARLQLDRPINIHLTGCHHSCAQHYIGDIGLLAAKVDRGDDAVEGYVVHVGGGAGPDGQAMAREIYPATAFDDLPPLIERMLRAYLAHRRDSTEDFRHFTRRHDIEALQRLFDAPVTLAAE